MLFPLIARFNLSVDSRIGIDELPSGERPVDHYGFTNDIIFGNVAPIARVVALRTIIAHDEVIVEWNFPAVFGRRRIGWLADIWFVDGETVDRYSGRCIVNSIARKSNNSFDEIFGRVLGKVEDDDIPSFGWMEEVGDFIDQDILIALQTGLHTHAINAVALNGKANN